MRVRLSSLNPSYRPGRIHRPTSPYLFDVCCEVKALADGSTLWAVGCGCLVILGPGRQYTDIMPGCAYGHPWQWKGEHA